MKKSQAVSAVSGRHFVMALAAFIRPEVTMADTFWDSVAESLDYGS